MTLAEPHTACKVAMTGALVPAITYRECALTMKMVQALLQICQIFKSRSKTNNRPIES